jgi:hypothetical protein
MDTPDDMIKLVEVCRLLLCAHLRFKIIHRLENLEEQQTLQGKQTSMVAKRHVALEHIFSASSGFNSST